MVVLALGCDNMKCRNPYIEAPNGTDAKGFVNSKAVRNSVTPHPCGQCLACRISKSNEWTSRILLEQRTHSASSFLTLTYEDEKLPLNDDGQPILVKKDLVDFLKRLRYYKEGTQIRHFSVGEYGDKSDRPHFHAAIFGLHEWEKTPVEKSWQNGFSYLATLNAHTARYISGYILKNHTKETEEELYGKPPEFSLMSRGTKLNGLGGLGRAAIQTIATNIKSQPGTVKLPDRIKLGGCLLPVGRYLRKKLANDLGISDYEWEKKVCGYQLEQYNKYNSKEMNYYKSIFKESNQRAQNLEVKHKMLQQKRRY